MKSFLCTFFLAAITAGVSSPVARKLANGLGALSRPGGRNVNAEAIPRFGGLALYLGFFAAIAALLISKSDVAEQLSRRSIVGLFAGSTLLLVVGLADDVRGVRPAYKLAAHVLSAAVAYGCGFRISVVNFPLFAPLDIGILSFPITVFWIVGIVNAINLIDGLDGLAAGIVFFASITNFVIANINHSIFIATAMAALIGTVCGFLYHNFNPARIFMGDSGSYFLGYVLGTSILVGSRQTGPTAVSIFVPCLAMGVPIFDMLFTILRRHLEKRPIFSADRGHIHHRLLDMGITHRHVVLILYAATFAFCVFAIALYIGRVLYVGLALLGSSIVVVTLMRFAGYFEYLQSRYSINSARDEHRAGLLGKFSLAFRGIAWPKK